MHERSRSRGSLTRENTRFDETSSMSFMTIISQLTHVAASMRITQFSLFMHKLLEIKDYLLVLHFFVFNEINNFKTILKLMRKTAVNKLKVHFTPLRILLRDDVIVWRRY